MSNLSRILVPMDFSPACDRALAHGASIAMRTGAELHVLHVQVLHQDLYEWSSVPNIEAVEKIIADQSRHDLERAVEDIKPTVIHETIRDVKAARAIVHYAESQKIDLIAMGTHARKGAAHMFLGSVAAEVVRYSPVSVLVIGPEHVIPTDIYRRVLVPVDFSTSADAALQQGAAIARQHGAELIVLHVVEPRIQAPYDGAHGTPEELRELAVRSLDELLEKANLPTPPKQKLIALGAPDEQVVSCAREQTIDLIVMGTVGRSGLNRLLLGSTTERVLRSAPCAVLAHRGEIHADM